MADAAQRRAVLADVLDPARLGVEVAVLGGGRCDADALRARVAMAADRPGLLIIEYGVLPMVELPKAFALTDAMAPFGKLWRVTSRTVA